jgi:AcrR family transcriptional regulator
MGLRSVVVPLRLAHLNSSPLFSRQFVTHPSHRNTVVTVYTSCVPKLWAETVQTHRHEVRDAIVEAAGELVLTQGLLAVNMSQIADAAGIGRATLYKYFPDVEHVLMAWHGRQVAAHLASIAAIRDRAGEPAGRLRAVLEEYARICRQRDQHGGEELAAALHRSETTDRSKGKLLDIVAELIDEAAAAGAVRQDVSGDELAPFCINALAAAATSSTPPKLARLVDLIWTALTPCQLTAPSRAES